MRWGPLVLAVALATSSARAEDWPPRWTTTDLALQSAVVVALVADWNQSRRAAARVCYGRPCGTEMNQILGPRPTVRQVDAYFAACAAGHALVSAVLPRPYRTVWQIMWIGIEGDTIRRNYQAGVAVGF